MIEKKDSEAEEWFRREAFEQKYLTRITQEYTATLATFHEKVREKKVALIDAALNDLSQRLRDNPAIDYGEKQQDILKLKLARHFKREDHINTALLYDAIVETPKFINNYNGSIHRLFDIHQQKQLMLIAERRKRRAEQTHDDAYKPYEALFTTSSQKYYMARLLNMPHLEEESDYIRHCVGNSDSYINKMKKGQIEILSFRNVPTFNTEKTSSIPTPHSSL